MPLQKILHSSGKDACQKPAKQTDLYPAGQEKIKNEKKTTTYKTEKPNVHLEVIMQPYILHCSVCCFFFFHVALKNEVNLDSINPLKLSNIIVIILYKIIQNENDHE